MAVGKKTSRTKWLALICINLIYACTYICMKKASGFDFLSSRYFLWVFGAFVIMGIYALLWQQILAETPLSTAYMFKGTSLIFVLLLSTLLFGEGITMKNIIGSAIIVSGILLFART